MKFLLACILPKAHQQVAAGTDLSNHYRNVKLDAVLLKHLVPESTISDDSLSSGSSELACCGTPWKTDVP